jgi:serine/threonine protein kinase
MKVLLLTLHSDPPTLDRSNAKKRFTKTFKDMIDSCLQKDHSKRPSAEKLLQNSFFKHSKKLQYLVDNVVKKIPPVLDRQHKGKVDQFYKFRTKIIRGSEHC